MFDITILFVFVMFSLFVVIFFVQASRRQIVKTISQQHSLHMELLKTLNEQISKLTREALSMNPDADVYEENNTQSVKDFSDSEELSETKIYIGNVDYNTSEEELEDHFGRFGEIEFVNIPVNRYNGKARGFGFVSFNSQGAAARAVELDGSEFRGRQIQVNFAKERLA